MNSYLLLIFGSLIIAGTFASKISSRSGIPILLIFLFIGMLVGSDVLNLIYLDNYVFARDIANVALIFILFDSGFNTSRENLKATFGPSITLATFGIMITAAILGILIHLMLKLDILYSLMIGSIISSTDAAAVMTVMREKPVKQKVSSTLEIESAANDPMAILLTLFIIQLVQNTGDAQAGDYVKFTLTLIWQFIGGIICARLCSWGAIWLYNHFKSDNQALYYVLYIGTVVFIYSAADIIGANGTIAIFFAGYWLGNANFVFKRGVTHFVGGLSSFANMAIFLLLGILVFPRSMISVWQQGLILAAILIFAARPLTVFLCTFPFKFTLKERLFISWGGLKGAVPIVLATYPAAFGLDPNGFVFNIVFFVVVLSCLLQGTTLAFLGAKLKLLVQPKNRSPYSLELFALDKTDLDLFDIEIHENSAMTGKKIQELSLPEDTLISSLVRGKKIISPRGNTVIHPQDILFILTKHEHRNNILCQFNSEHCDIPEKQPEQKD